MKRLHVRLRALERAVSKLGAVRTQLIVRERSVVAEFPEGHTPGAVPGAYYRPERGRWRYTLHKGEG